MPSSRPPRAQNKTVSVDELADKLSSISFTNVKGKQKAATPREQKVAAMRAANAASQVLSNFIRSGQKKSAKTLKELSASAISAATHFDTLRELCPLDIDVERAASSVLAKLITLEMYDLALSALTKLHGQLCLLANCDETSLRSLKTTQSSHNLHLLFFPLVNSTDQTLLKLISHYLLHSLIVLFSTSQNLPSFAKALTYGPSFLEWIPSFSPLQEQQIESLLGRLYSTLTKSTSSSDPGTLFVIRAYALSCLAYSSSDSLKRPDHFWDQACKFAASYVKSCITIPVQEEASRVISSSFTKIVALVEKRDDSDIFFQGNGFMGFCEYWMSIANKTGDLALLNLIAKKIQSAPVLPSPPAPTQQANMSDDILSMECTKLIATLTQITASLTQTTVEAKQLSSLAEALKTSPVTSILLSSPTQPESLQLTTDKLGRTLERLRKTVVKLLEGSDHSQPTGALRQLLEAIIDILRQRLQTQRDSESSFTPVLDGLVALARTGMNVGDPRTYITAYDYLERAMVLLGVKDESNSPLPRLANHIRCLSGAFHNAAGALYQAGKYGSAIGFLKDGCRLGSVALTMWKSSKTPSKEGWKQLGDQLHRRWQLLAVCYTKIEDRKLAFEAYIQCIKTFPYVETGFEHLTASKSLNAVFASSPAFEELAGVIERLTYLGACELLLPADKISLDKLNLEPGTTGALLEKQLDSLESGRSKDIVRPIIVAIMKSAINVFTNGDMPLRKIRILLRALEFAYHVGPSVIACIGAPDDIGRTIECLVARETFGSDQGLSQFCSQLRASAHLLLALHAHRRADPKQVLVIGQHVTEACNLLKALLAQSSIASAPPQKSPNARILKPKNEAVSLQRIKTAPPKTPKRKPPKSMQEVSLQPSSGPRLLSEYTISLVIEDVNGLTRLLTLTSQILNLLSLALPRLHTLDLLKVISEQYRGRFSDDFIVASTNLGCEYVRLGQLKRAGVLFSQVFPGIQQVSVEAKIVFFLRYAESFALMDDVRQSVTFYLQALDLCQYLIDDKKGSTLQRVHNRVARLERAATACYVFSVIQYSRDDPLASLQALLQALRLWNRAFEALNRLHPPVQAFFSATHDDPFQESALKEASLIEKPKPTHKRSSMDVMEWRISQGLLATMFALCQAYKERGSVREAEYFAQETKELAEALNAPIMIGRALGQKAELQLHQGLLEEGSLTVSKALAIQQNLPGVDAAEMMRLQAEYSEQIACHEDAHQSYALSSSMLDELNQSFNDFDGSTFESRQSLGQRKKSDEVVFPDLVAKVLRQQIWLLRDHNSESYNTLVDRFFRLPATSRVKIEGSFLDSQLALHSVQKRFKSDIYLSSIAESTIALPLGSSNGPAPAMTQSSQDMLQNLDNTEKLFWSDLSLVSRRGRVFHVRDSLLSLATIRAFQTSLGRLDNIGSQIVATLLDRGAAITLRRELVEAISQKCFGNSDDLKWPSLDEVGKPLPPSQLNSSAHLLFHDSDDGAGASMKKYWESLLTAYQSHHADLRSFSASQTSSLPKNWTIVHISVTGQNTLFVSRQRGGSSEPPLVFCIPLKGRREDDDDEHLAFEDAIKEFKDIVRLNNETTKSAIRVKEQEAKAQWWKQRRALDTRMRELVENIEFCWLGAFKTILSPCPNHSSEVIAKLRLEFDKVFQQGLHLQDKKTKQRALGHKKVASESETPNRVTMDDALVECFSTLSPQCRDEELEDLVYFMLDLYQFYGVPVAVAEIDVTQVVIDLRSVLEEHHRQTERREIQRGDSDEHIFLILDKNVQGLPWENIPVLRGRSVSRVPCLDFLLDRMQLARRQKQAGVDDVVDRAVMDPRKAYYILNPSGDLTRTEGRFKDWVKTMEGVGWKGLIGSAPSEQQMEDVLQRNDLVLYFGHGGGEQYIRSHRIRHLRRCGALILWGCSSGILHETGEFDRVGTPFHYMVAGCPTLVANLWDVTDGDIDKFSQAVLDKWQMTAERVRGWERESSQSKGTSLVAAVAQSRDACKLKYLTGAAPVVYGIPLYL